MRKLLLLISLVYFQIAALHASCYSADSIVADTVNRRSVHDTYKFGWRQMAAPGALIVTGAITVAPSFLRNGSRWTTRQVMGWRGNRTEVDNYIQYLPVVGAVCLDFTGVKARHNFRDRVFITATSYAALGVLTNVPKWCINEQRPQYASQNSFPSGHTATAFMGAELVRIEYGAWSGAAAYAVATTVGVLRMYNGRHWLHDVVAGAGVGILSARIGEWSAPVWQRLCSRRKRKSKTQAIVIPTASPFYGGNVAANMVVVW